MLISNPTLLPDGQSSSLNFQSVPVRRLILVCPQNDLILTYKGMSILRTIGSQSMYVLDFNSYHGYPDASEFAVSNYQSQLLNCTVLVDYLPEMPINSDYFIEV